MNFNILYTTDFRKELKRLSKKYPSLKSDFALFLNSLNINPTQGTALGNNIYKIRLRIDSKNTGKSGGARIITFVQIYQKEVYLISIYDKSEKATISDADIKKRVQPLYKK